MSEESDGSPGFRGDIVLAGKARDALSEVRLTAAATALLMTTPELQWVATKAQTLRLPEDEFEVIIGVKVERGYDTRVDVKYLPQAIVEAANRSPSNRDIVEHSETTTLAKVAVKVVAIELAFKWHAGSSEANTVTIPLAFPLTVLRIEQREAVWRTKIRWLMTELVLSRYGLDSYREFRK